MTASKYRDLILMYLNELISLKEFEEKYFSTFKAEPRGMDLSLHEVLSHLFIELDSCWEEIPPGQDTKYHISEETFRKEAQEAVNHLNEYIYRTGKSN